MLFILFPIILITTQTCLVRIKKKKKNLLIHDAFPSFALFLWFPLLKNSIKVLSNTPFPIPTSHYLLLCFSWLVTTEIALIKVINDIPIVKFNSQFLWRGFFYALFSTVFQAARLSPNIWTVLSRHPVNEKVYRRQTWASVHISPPSHCMPLWVP